MTPIKGSLSMDRGTVQPKVDQERERIERESAEKYRRSVEQVNNARDSDIEKSLRS